MAHSPDKKYAVRAAYIGGLPLETAARQADVPPTTARRWLLDARKRGDDWDRFRNASLIVSGGGIEEAMGRIIAAALMRCEALLETPPEDVEASIRAMATLGDTIAKLKSASGSWMPKADRLAIETEAVKRFADLFVRRYPADGAKVVEVMEAFARGE